MTYWKKVGSGIAKVAAEAAKKAKENNDKRRQQEDRPAARPAAATGSSKICWVFDCEKTPITWCVATTTRTSQIASLISALVAVRGNSPNTTSAMAVTSLEKGPPNLRTGANLTGHPAMAKRLGSMSIS